MTLSNRYAALKKRVGGNREVFGFEYTFGKPMEEQMNITAPNKANKRILAETEFAIALSKELGGKYDELIDKELTFLEGEMEKNGALTIPACKKAEKMLLPMSADAKEYNIILAGHAHIDMNWMWSWHETVAVTLATFRTMLKIMDEYPDFCFSQSQASVYRIVEEYEPELMEQIKKRIKEGRWEVTASAWVETDKNMPSTESLIRHIKYTKNYLKEVWDIDPDELEIDFSPDTFGHSANLPELDFYGGVKYYYHCRGLTDNKSLYRWIAPSGKELLCYKEQEWYNSGITPKIAKIVFDVAKKQAGFKTFLIVYGVGDHGGGPTRRDVESALEMMTWPVFPAIKSGTFREFFKKAESIRDKLPIVNREMNFIFPGCYTTQSRIKMGNRMTENAFRDTETLGALASAKAGRKYSNERLEKSYRNVLFTHFHDILTGSCVQDSREYAMGLYSQSLALANNESLLAMRAVSEATDTSNIKTSKDMSSQSEGAGSGFTGGFSAFSGKPVPETGNGITRIFTVFNPTPVAKKENVEITVWDWPGDLRYINVADADGKPLEFQMLSGGFEHYWDHKFFRILVNLEIKAAGYRTVVLDQKENEGLYPVYFLTHPAADVPNANIVLENEFIRAEFDYTNAALVSLKDKASGIEYIEKGKAASFVVIDTERQTSDAWHIGKYQRITPVTRVTRLNAGGGKLRSSMSFEATILGSRVNAEVFIDKGSRHVSYKTEVDWNEAGGETVPVFAYALPLSYKAEKYLYDIPAGTARREAMDMDVPALSFALAPVKDGPGAAIINDSKYGYRARPDGTLISTFINSAVSPDKYPERGIHKFTMSLALIPDDAKAATEYAQGVCRRPAYVSASSHKGALKADGALFDIKAEVATISSIETAEDGDILVRAFSQSSEKSVIELRFGENVADAKAVDYFNNDVPGEVRHSGKKVTAALEPRCIITLKIKLK
ncbi:MAG: alpha-mannosidase [Clostridia bacterium]|nr:alpha-mannosidase [Clostridia bacterium]